MIWRTHKSPNKQMIDDPGEKTKGKEKQQLNMKEKIPWLPARCDCRVKVLTELEQDLLVSDNNYAFYDEMLEAQR